MKLFCLAHAGGHAAAFATWKPFAPAWLDIVPLDLPAHGDRRSEPPCADWPSLVRDMRTRLLARCGDAPFGLFGHSLGGMVANELAHASESAAKRPLFLGMAASSRGPERHAGVDWLHCPDWQVIDHLRDLGGTSPEILDNQEMMTIVLPTLRADLHLCGIYAPRDRPRLNVPVTVFGGTADTLDPAMLAQWRQETAGPFDIRMIEGDHFFPIRAPAETVREVVAAVLAAVPLAGTTARQQAE